MSMTLTGTLRKSASVTGIGIETMIVSSSPLRVLRVVSALKAVTFFSQMAQSTSMNTSSA